MESSNWTDLINNNLDNFQQNPNGKNTRQTKKTISNVDRNHQIRHTKDFYSNNPVADILLNYSKPTISNTDKKMSEDNNLFLIKYKKTDDMDDKINNKNLGSKKREVYSLFLFIFFLFVTIITLSQILVMHNQSHNTNFIQIKAMQDELKLMDKTIDTMLREKLVLPMQVWYAMKQYKSNIKRFTSFLTVGLDLFTTNETYNHENINNYESLVDSLTKCKDFTQNKLSHMTNDNGPQLKLIYNVLLKFLNNTRYNDIHKTYDNITNSQIGIQSFSKELNLALESSLIKIGSIDFKSEELKETQNQCLRIMIMSVFNIFSSQYNSFFSSEPKLSELLMDRYSFINKTLVKYNLRNKHNNEESNLFLKTPLRNMNNYYERYKNRLKKFDPSQKSCDAQPPNLRGPLKVIDVHHVSDQFVNNLKLVNSEVKLGGQWSPNCTARHKLAVIIPYRDRYDHLMTLLSYLHPILQRQQMDYKVYVAEQYGNGTFNKGIIMNAAFTHAFDEDNFNCYCFHDVDLVPEDDRNMYSCGKNPKHMSVGVDEMNYQLAYEELIGGVLILNPKHLIKSNGYSNLYWGWGAEDDDLYYRLKGLSFKVERPPLKIGRYKMMKHTKRKPQLWSKRAKLLYSSVNRMTWDGISSAKYNILAVTEHKLYTHLSIDVGVPPAGFN